jgi:hypothetical protein
MKTQLLGVLAVPLILLICLGLGCEKREETPATQEEAKGDLQLPELPQVVMNGLKAKFPTAEIHEWTREQEDSVPVYDIEFAQDGWKFEADVKEDGSIHSWEKAIDPEDLPEAVTQVVETEHPESTIKEAMEVTMVTDGMDVLEGYEIVLEGSGEGEGEGEGEVEIMVAPDGTILEESGHGMPDKE